MEGLDPNYSNDINLTKVDSSSSVKDTYAPVINIKQKAYVIYSGDKVDFLNDVTAYDNVDGDVTNNIVTNINTIDFNTSGVKKVEYKVVDSSGNMALENIYVTVKNNNKDLIKLGQISIIVIIALLFIFICKYIRSLKLEKRFSKFTINSSKNKSISLFDNLYNQYIDFINKISKVLSKSIFIKNRAKKYEKYNSLNINNNGVNIISRKIIYGFLFILFTTVIYLLQSKLVGILEILVSFIIGYYILDIIYLIKYHKYKSRLKNDMLDAITLMNNAFKAGMSIIQAVELVSRELDGPIGIEFNKISTDINAGLDIEVAFKRFSDRVKSDEAIYLSSSLSVLNKTGGNIIKVFDSIEKNMFNRKKLQNELKSLTSSSRLIMYVLMIVPPLFVVFINIINKDYFKPMLNNPLGIVLLIIIVVIYLVYIIVVRKILKVRNI